MKIFEFLVIRVGVAFALLCPALGYGQTDGAPADMRVVVMKSKALAMSGSNTFDHIATGRPGAT